MSIYLSAIEARYSARASATDAFGRIVEVRRLRPADSFWTRQVAASDLTDVTTEALIASSVCSLTEPDGRKSDLHPPRTGPELSARLNLLEAEGMSAAMAAYARLVGASVPDAAEPKQAAGGGDGATLDGGGIASALTQHMAEAGQHRRTRGRHNRPSTASAAE